MGKRPVHFELKKLITAVEKNARVKIASLETMNQKRREELTGQVKKSQLSVKSYGR